MPPRASDAKILVVGGGPAGLEATQALGKRGHEVILVDANRTLGGRVTKEARLPGLAAWIRVVDYRVGQIERLANVEEARGVVTAEEILGYDFDHVAVATGARWRADGVGRFHTHPIALDPALPVLTPDDLMNGERPKVERVLIYDDDHYYMGGVLAELLRAEGYAVTLVTPGLCASSWTAATMEQHRIQRRLLELDVDIQASRAVTATMAGGVATTCVFTGAGRDLACDAVLFVTARLPEDSLYRDILARRDEWEDAGLRTVKAVGDCWSPGTIAAAVWEGHRYAEELDDPRAGEDVPLRREVTELADTGTTRRPEGRPPAGVSR
jgi:dimethylamine/trimethylamine dehydrogenase